MKETSYTAANSIPYKIFKDTNLIKYINEEGRLRARHIQFIPTNRCNLNCAFCSCSERDKKVEMSWETCNDIIEKFMLEGMLSVTITGGGEPTLYTHFNKMIDRFDAFGIKIGLVTNGLNLGHVPGIFLDKLTWCRISSGDDRDFNNAYYENLLKAVTTSPNVDWAFSHVVSKEPNLETIRQVVEFANEFEFTHVRFVPDLFNVEEVDLDKVKNFLKEQGIDDSKVIYQNRQDYCKGVKDCWISLLKPVIDAKGDVYPCCGFQYSEIEPSKGESKVMCMGNYNDYIKDLRENKPFDGRVCHKCYYNNYNEMLDILLNNEIKHKEFI